MKQRTSLSYTVPFTLVTGTTSPSAMNNTQKDQDQADVEQASSSQESQKLADDVVDEPVQHIHAKTIILLVVSNLGFLQGNTDKTRRWSASISSKSFTLPWLAYLPAPSHPLLVAPTERHG